MAQTHEQNTFRSPDMWDLLRLARTYWRGITVITLLCAVIAWTLTSQEPKLYSTTVRGLVVATGGEDLGTRQAGAELALRQASAYQYLAESRPVAERVIEELDLKIVPEQLLDSITVEVPPESTEIQITGYADTPEGAKRLADAWMGGLIQEVLEMENPGKDSNEASGMVYIRPLNVASLPKDLTAPNFPLKVATGVLTGLVLGIFYALIRFRLENNARPD